MIRAKFELTVDPGDNLVCSSDSQLALRITEESVKEFHYLLRRALNCEDPQKYKDWVELCDRLDSLKLSGKI